MNQQGMAAAVKPHWVADLVVGVTGAFAAVAVAQAALPSSRAEPVRAQPTSAPLTVQRISAAPVDLPDFVYGEPVYGYDVVSPFGLRQLPWEQAGRLHAGVDIAAPSGYPVQAAADGVVVRAGYDGGYGRFVEIRHAEGITSLYGHLGGVAEGVERGMRVKRGAPVGRVGNTGSSTGAHLHFEVRDRRGRPLNPALFIGRQYATARDLPLKQAARIPRGVRIAYVSYIPKKKRELMEAREAAEAAKDSRQVASLDGAKATGTGKATVSQPQVVRLPPADTAPVSTWVQDPYDIGVDMPGWPGSS